MVTNQSHENPIRFLGSSLESSLCDCSDVHILVTGNITFKRRNVANNTDIVLGAITQVAFKNRLPFKSCRTEINDTFVDEVNFVNIAMPMYNLVEYSGNYSDTLGSLWQFKRDKIANSTDVTNDNNASSFIIKQVL